MERDWLEAQVQAGRSIEDIAREVGRHPSTVAYWMNRFGLVSVHASRHRPRGGIPRAELERLVEAGLSVRQIAAQRGVSATAVRHWLRKHGLKTHPARYARRDESKPPAIARECSEHGFTIYVRVGRQGHYRCARCNGDRVARRRRRIKEILVEEAGGACLICGYSRYLGALQFHHLDPAAKEFELSLGGLTRGIDAARQEAAKCVVLCSNCHAEVEAAVTALPTTMHARADPPGPPDSGPG